MTTREHRTLHMPARARAVGADWQWPALVALGVIAISVWTAWIGDSWQVRGGDYGVDYAPAMNALLDGHIGSFFASLPYNGAGGSVLLRAPFALMGKLLVGSQLATFRFGALGCLLALGALGVWLAASLRARGASASTCLGVLVVFAGAPALLNAALFGHPEEALGAALCVASVLLAGAARPRPALAGALLGAAVINKPWGVFAVGPVLLCAQGARRRVLLPAGAIAGGWLLIAGIEAPSRLVLSLHGAGTSIVAHPQDLWWPLAHTVGFYPVPPAFLSSHARQLAVVLALAATALVAVRAHRLGRRLDVRRCLALLAFGFALRCVLEPSAHDYYQLPFLAALASWEVRARSSVTLSLSATILLALDFRRLSEAAPAVPFVLYLAIMLPLCGLLLADLLSVLERRSGKRGRMACRARLDVGSSLGTAARPPAR